MAKRGTRSAAGKTKRRLGSGILVGILIGVAVSIAVAIYVNRAALQIQDNNGISAPERSSVIQEQDDVEFDFYKLLPSADRKDNARPEGDDSEQSISVEVLFLQVAALSNAQEADNLKARLALNGFESRIQATALSDGTLLHRVRLGPYSTQREMESVRQRLQEFNFETTVVRVSN